MIAYIHVCIAAVYIRGVMCEINAVFRFIDWDLLSVDIKKKWVLELKMYVSRNTSR